MSPTVINHLRTGSFVVAAGATLFAGNYYRIASHIADVEARGHVAAAKIEGGRVASARKGGSTLLTLSWKDRDGIQRRASDIVVSPELASRIVTGDRLSVSELSIKYRADRPNDAPIIVEDVGNRRSASEDGWKIMAAIAALAGLAGVACSFARRRVLGVAAA